MSMYTKYDLYELNNHCMETVIVSFAVRRFTYFLLVPFFGHTGSGFIFPRLVTTICSYFHEYYFVKLTQPLILALPICSKGSTLKLQSRLTY